MDEFDAKDTRNVYARLAMNPKGTPKKDALRAAMSHIENDIDRYERHLATSRRHLAAARAMFKEECR